MPPLLRTTFRRKWGGGVCSNIQFISCKCPLLLFTVEYARKVDNHDDCCSFLKEQQLR